MHVYIYICPFPYNLSVGKKSTSFQQESEFQFSTHTHTHTQKQTQTLSLSHTHTHAHTRTHTYTHKHAHTRTHTYTRREREKKEWVCVREKGFFLSYYRTDYGVGLHSRIHIHTHLMHTCLFQVHVSFPRGEDDYTLQHTEARSLLLLCTQSLILSHTHAYIL